MKKIKKIFLLILLYVFISELKIVTAQEEDYCAPCRKKGIYITSYTATSSKMKKLIELIKNTELDMAIIDVKVDVSSLISDKKKKKIKNVIEELHRDNIWVAARIVVFRDHTLAKSKPHLALKKEDDKKWGDSQGVYWVDPASEEVWDYNIEIAKQAIDLGFDEINFDYIRFPSDGKLSVIEYPVYNKKISKYKIMNAFYKKLRDELKAYKKDIILSADIFGFTLIVKNDLQIGQKLSDLIKYFDVICPMVYPSHYSKGNFGFKNPVANPYGIIFKTIKAGKITLGKDYIKIRPWLQDFSIRGVSYDSDMIRLEKKAVYDSNLYGWSLWNASNNYTKDAIDYAN